MIGNVSPWLLLVFSMTACLAATIIRKFCVNAAVSIRLFGFFYNTVVSLTAAVVLFLTGGFSSVSRFTLLLGLVFGAVTAAGQIFNIRAIDSGPLSYTSVINALASVLPTLCGVLFWGETIAPIQWAGIVLMLFCMILSVEKKENEKGKSVKWLLYCGVSFLCTGTVGILQKWHQNTEYKDELTPFLIIAFAFSAFTSIVGQITERKKGTGAGGLTKLRVPVTVALLLVGGVCVAMNNKWNLYLSGVMDSAVFFPIVNGGGLVLTTLAAFIVFKEKLSEKQRLGICLGILSVIFVCNPFQ